MKVAELLGQVFRLANHPTHHAFPHFAGCPIRLQFCAVAAPRNLNKTFAGGLVVFVLAYGGGSVTDLHRLPSGPEKHATIADNNSRICNLLDAPAGRAVSAIDSGTVKRPDSDPRKRGPANAHPHGAIRCATRAGPASEATRWDARSLHPPAQPNGWAHRFRGARHREPPS